MPRSAKNRRVMFGMCRGDSGAGEVLEGLVRRIGGRRGGQPAAPVAEVAQPRQLGAGLGDEVDARDADVGHAVADELDDVVRAHEQDVEIEVLDARNEAAVMLLEHEAGVMEECERRIDESTLVGDGQAEAVVRRPRAGVHGATSASGRSDSFTRSNIAR